MEKLPRSGPLFDAMFEAVSAVNALGNASGTPGGVNEGESLESIYKRVAKKYEVPLDLLKKADNNFNDVFEQSPTPTSFAKKYKSVIADLDKEATKQIEKNIAKAAPMETPYGKSSFSYTPEGKIAGLGGKILRGAAKVAGPVGAAMTAGELGGALAEVRKLGAEKIASENEAKQAGYTPEERLKLKDMLKKLRAEAKLR